ncbi:MAG: PAS domain S-box protein [Chloroflexi bacterium]|nr:PAS domain S-box protein [Chloroflexota bacterium]
MAERRDLFHQTDDGLSYENVSCLESLRAPQHVLETMAMLYDPETLVQVVAQQVSVRLGYPAVAVLARQPSETDFSVGACYPKALLEQGLDLSPASLSGIYLRQGDVLPPAHRALQEGYPWVSRRLSAWLPSAQAEQFEAAIAPHVGAPPTYMAFPALSYGELVAVLLVATPAVAVDPTQWEILQTVGRQLAVSLESAYLHQATQRRLAEMTALRRLAVKLSEPQPLACLLERIVREATHILGAMAGTLYLLDEERGDLELVVGHNLSPDIVGMRQRLGEGMAGQVAQTGQPLAIDDYAEWSRRWPPWQSLGVTVALGVPLQWAGRILGVIAAGHLEPHRPFSESDVWSLSLFAQQASVAVENARLMESLRQEKRFSERLIETAPALVLILTLDGRIEWFNEACEGLTGYGKEEALGQNWFDLVVPPEVYPAQEALMARLRRGDIPAQYENAIRTRDGEVRHILWSSAGIEDQDGRVSHILALGQDLTLQRKAEAELLRRNIELEMLVQAGQEFFSGMDWEPTLWQVARRAQEFLKADSCILFLREPGGEVLRPVAALGPDSEAVMQVTVRPGEGITGHVAHSGEPEMVNRAHRDPRALLVPGTLPEPESLLLAPLAAHGETMGVLVASRLGRREFVREDLRLVTGLATLAAGAIRNAHLYEQVSREADRRADMMESMGEGLLVQGPDGCIQQVNSAFCEMTGFRREELLGLCYPFPHWPTEERESLTRDHREILRRGKPIGPVQREYQRKDGSRFPVSISLAPVRDASGTVTSFISVYQDRTEWEKLEARLRQAQKLESIGTLAGGVAHDFNNILMGIMGYASLLQVALPADSPLQSDVATIIRSSRRAADLTQNLLTFARVTEPSTEPVDLNALVAEVQSLLLHTLDRRIEIMNGLQPDLPTVRGDPSQLQQVVLNLCINGAEAMPDGGRLTFRTSVQRLDAAEAHPLQPGAYVVLEVEDTGQGMDEATQRRIFDPFFTTKEHGKGLGLATSYGIVGSHGGLLSVRSARGQGATFRVALPASDSAAGPTPPSLGAPHAGGPETILVVDGEEAVQEMMARVLGRAGYRVLTAGDGAEALTVVARHPGEIDLVILDVMRPRMGGAEALQRLRAADHSLRILISSEDSETQELQALRPQVQGFLPKPFDLDYALQSVRAVLDGRPA